MFHAFEDWFVVFISIGFWEGLISLQLFFWRRSLINCLALINYES